MTELTEISDDYTAIVYENGTAHTTSLKTLRRKVRTCPTLNVSAPTGATITISMDDMTYTKVGESVTFDVPEYGTWKIVAELDGSSVTKSMKIDTIKIYELSIEF